MKARVAILYSGNMRSNSLNPSFTKDNIILESTKKHLLNNDFINKYDYDVFFSVDSIDIQKAIDFFGENLKNIHLTEQNWFLKEPKESITDYSIYYNKFLSNDFEGKPTHQHGVYQYYRLYCAYNLMKDYQTATYIKYDFIIRIRPDIRLMQNVMPLFNILEKTDCLICSEHEQLCIVKYELHEMFDFIKYIGSYNESISAKSYIYNHYVRKEDGGQFPIDDNFLMYSPEKQFVDNVYYFILKLNKDFNKSFIGIAYPSYNLLYRENGKYGYISDHHPIYYDPDHKWIPDTILSYTYQTYL